jgi:hypothetical protein
LREHRHYEKTDRQPGKHSDTHARIIAGSCSRNARLVT